MNTPAYPYGDTAARPLNLTRPHVPLGTLTERVELDRLRCHAGDTLARREAAWAVYEPDALPEPAVYGRAGELTALARELAVSAA